VSQGSFPVPGLHAGLRSRSDFPGHSGGDLLRALRAETFRRLARVYVITALAALYFNFFVLVAQLFQKTPALKELAPTQTEPPFAIAQGIVLALFVVLGIAAVRQFRVQPMRG
jgi:hypothetical protein